MKNCKAATEELQSSNEEMQSLNEELETSKEELQSTNEELTIVNQELMDKQEQLNAARYYAESIVETVREPLLILNKALCVISANASFYKTFKMAEHDTEGKYLFELADHQWENDQLRLLLQKSISEKSKIEDFEIIIDFDGIGRRTMLFNARQIVNKFNEEQLILLAIEDITVKKAAENKLKSFAEDLEKEVKERTSDLMQSHMQLSQFAYVASHDLQEPLRKILTFCSRLLEKQKEALPADVKTYINKIDGAAGRMRKLIDELLEYSRLITYDKLFEPTDLNVILENVMTDFELMIEDKKAKITSNTLPVIQAIPMQMNQLFYNLISNALKFSQEDRTACYYHNVKQTFRKTGGNFYFLTACKLITMKLFSGITVLVLIRNMQSRYSWFFSGCIKTINIRARYWPSQSLKKLLRTIMEKFQ
jgi:two-component system CheB/CheR fusion protein